MRATRDHDEALQPVSSGADPFVWVCGGMAGLFALLIVALIGADVWYLVRHGETLDTLGQVLARPSLRRAVGLSLTTSLCSLLLTLVFSLPVGYVLSRGRFPGHAGLDTLVDVPIVVPPVVIGVSLLAFFGTGIGQAMRQGLAAVGGSLVSGLGIVLCQFLVSAPYCIRAVRSAFNEVDREAEAVAMVLGCSRWGAFRRVTLPLARSGLVAGGVMAWARAIGVFGPIMAFIGTGPRVQILPTCIWLELSIGNIEVSLVMSLVMLALAGAALLLVHVLAPGRTWT